MMNSTAIQNNNTITMRWVYRIAVIFFVFCSIRGLTNPYFESMLSDMEPTGNNLFCQQPKSPFPAWEFRDGDVRTAPVGPHSSHAAKGIFSALSRLGRQIMKPTGMKEKREKEETIKEIVELAKKKNPAFVYATALVLEDPTAVPKLVAYTDTGTESKIKQIEKLCRQRYSIEQLRGLRETLKDGLAKEKEQKIQRVVELLREREYDYVCSVVEDLEENYRDFRESQKYASKAG